MKQPITVITSWAWHSPERAGDSMEMIPGGWEPDEFHEIEVDIPDLAPLGAATSDWTGTGDLCLCVGDESCGNCPNWDVMRKGD